MTKLTVLLFLLGMTHAFAFDSYAQTTRLSLNYSNVILEEVLEDIEQQSEFFFLYNKDLIDVAQKVDVEVRNKNINEILDQLFEGKEIRYFVFDRQIVLSNQQGATGISGRESLTVQQQRTVSGTVSDETGEPLPGVTVAIKGTTQGTVTNSDGEYSLTNIPEDAIMVFSFMGMKTQEVEVGNQTSVSITMEMDAIGLDEVVAIGYGTQKRANVIGSVTSVSEEDLTAAPVSRVSNALAGRLPGAIFMQESGEPGSDAPTIRIRGNATVGNNSPLIVIDGIADRDINSLHPEDIESITVLKDASAAIYGSRAANGVILINTKRGAMEAPPTFTLGSYIGFLSPTKLPEMADAPTYARMIRENQSYRGVDESNMMFSEEDIAKYESGEYPWTHPNTDWFEVALKDYSTTRHHNLSVNGGSKTVSYYGSFGSQFDDGIYTNSNTSYNRYNLKASINVKVNEYLDLGIDITGSQENRMYPTKSQWSIFSTLVRMYPTFPAEFPNGLPGPDLEYGDQPMVMASDQTGFDDDKRYRSYNLLSANFKIPGVEGLSLSGSYAYDLYFQQRKRFEKSWVLYSLDESSYFEAGNTGKEDGSDYMIATTKGPPEPRLTDYSANSQTKTVNLKFGYVTTLNEVHNVDAFIAYEHNEFNEEGFNAYRRYFLSDRLPYLFAGGDEEKDNSGWVGLDARQNYFGRFFYSYKGTYLFQFSFRRDGSLRFSEESGRWGNFPSVLVGWRLSNEDWWKNNIDLIDYFKLRASWGQMGNDRVPAFQYLSKYGFTRGLPLGDSKTYQLGLQQEGAPNPFITWEVANVLNFGWESMFFNSKVSFETDLFYERRNNILVERNVSVPRFTGISLPDENFGVVDNHGIEVVLGYSDRAGSFNYGLNGNFAFVRNTIIEVDEPERPVPWQVRTGGPQGAHLLYKSLGVFRDEEHVNSLPHVTGARPGDIIIEDYDGDGEITGADRQLFPLTTTPEITFGFAFDLSYQNWELRGLIQGHGRALRYIYNDARQGTAGNYFMYDAIDRWTPDNPDGSKPRAFQWTEEYWRETHITDHHYTDISYARLKNLQLSYKLPSYLMNSIGVKNAKVYVAGQNLWLIYSGNKIMDPEVGGMGSYPIMRTTTLGAQISF